MEFDPILSGPSRDAFDQHAWESSGGGLIECDWAPSWAEPKPWEVMARRVADNPHSVFVCPPEWGYTASEFRTECSRTAKPAALNTSLLATGTIASWSVSGLAFTRDQPFAALILLVMGFVEFALLCVPIARALAARDRLDERNLDQVVEVTDPSGYLQDFATMGIRDLTDVLVRTPHGARSELYEMARDEAKADARTPTTAPATPVVPEGVHADAARRPSLDLRWTLVRERFEGVESEWEAIVTDPLAALDHAALLDVTRPRTAKFVEQFDDTKHLLRRLVDRFDDGCPDEDALVEFETAVRRSITTWDEAKRHARHLDIEALPAHEQPHADRARKALNVMLDEDAPIGERANAAREVERALKRVKTIVLRPPALAVVESVKRLAIEAAPA